MELVSNGRRSKSQDSCRSTTTPGMVVYVLDESEGVDYPEQRSSGSHREKMEKRERRRNLGRSYIQSQNSSVEKDPEVHEEDDVFTGWESANPRTHPDRDNFHLRPLPVSETKLLEDYRNHRSGGSMDNVTSSQVESRAEAHVKSQHQSRSNHQLSQLDPCRCLHFRQHSPLINPVEGPQPLFQSPNTLHIREPGERRMSSRAHDATSRQSYYPTTPSLASVRPGSVRSESIDFNGNRDDISHLNQRFVLRPQGMK